MNAHATAASFLAAANIRFVDLDDATPLDVRITRLPQVTFGLIRMPRSVIEWPRDRMSHGRGTIFISRNGPLTIESPAPIWTAHPGLFFIPPGETPLRLQFTDEVRELVYVSADTAVIRGIELPGRHRALAPTRVSEEVLAPLLAFIRGVCTSTFDGTAQVLPLQPVAAEVARALVRLITEDVSHSLSTYEFARRVIELEYPKAHILVGDIAAAANVSERTLHAAFAERDTTVMSELRATRVRAARELRAQNPGITRQELASAAGFGSISSMLRALKESE